MTKTQIAADKLWRKMPYLVNHFANQQFKTSRQICLDVAEYDSEWADRVTKDSGEWSLNDLRHDFVGLVNKEEFFVPRL
jgi:hypothetical protein